jgi:PAS domain-containing protein
VDHTTDPPLVRYYALTRENRQWEKAGEVWSKAVVDIWRRGVVAYRPDLLEEDPYQEREYIEAAYHHPVRSVIDIPFSHGTLGANSDRSNAFSSQDIAFLEELAKVLSEGFQRMSDLEHLARSEARYRSLVETPEFVVILLDTQGRYLYVSPQIESWTGHSPEAFTPITRYR